MLVDLDPCYPPLVKGLYILIGERVMCLVKALKVYCLESTTISSWCILGSVCLDFLGAFGHHLLNLSEVKRFRRPKARSSL